MEHDQRFKTLLKAFLVEFVALFFRTWSRVLYLEKPVWLEQEFFVDPPRGRTKRLDLLAGCTPT